MLPIDRILFTGLLPESFFRIPIPIYAAMTFSKSEDNTRIQKLFEEESSKNNIIIYTDHQHIRLVGIFPNEGVDAYFGFWETTNNVVLNVEAFEKLQNDAVHKKKTKLVGPLNFNTYQSYRLRLTSPSWTKFDQEPVNPLYYPLLLEELGFNTEMLFESRMIQEADIPGVYVVKEDLLKAFENIPFECISITPKTWIEYELQIFELVDAIFRTNPLYKSISYSQFTSLYNAAFAAKLCPFSSVFFKDKITGRLASLNFCQPNYEALHLPIGYKINYENDFQKLDHKILLVKSVGVHPDFRQQGLMNFMAAYAMLSFQRLYDEVIFCMTREDNLSNNFTQYLPYEKADYALFAKSLST